MVSVGEAHAVGSLITRLKGSYDYPIVISTTTLTGNKIARERYSEFVKVIFFPLDISFVLKRVLRIVNPAIFVAVETEIWPNLFRNLHQRNIPVVIVNGRISDKALRRYKLIRPVVKKVLAKCHAIGVQSPSYKDRFLSLGAAADKITISGNMKFESISVDKDIFSKIKEKYIPPLKGGNRVLLLAGCTHNPEEEIVVNIYKDIFADFKDSRLLLAPRHPQRVSSVERIVKAAGFRPVRISQMEDLSSGDILILDTIGELLYFYGISDVCFVGGSFSNDGGHNILEPIYFSKPTVFGPHMDNFRDIEQAVLEKGAGIKVRDPDELKEVLLSLLRDKVLRERVREKCIKVFEEEKRSLQSNLDIVSRCLG